MPSSLPIQHLQSKTVATLALVVMLSVAAACSSKPRSTGPAPSIVLPSASVTAAATIAAAPTAPPDNAPLAQFSMHGTDSDGKAFNVSGNIVVLGVDPATNVMQSPDNKDDVGYYDFTSHPGSGCQSTTVCSNTVLSGHVDWYTGQTGVFWDARFLQNNDEIDLKLQDGTVYKYKVVANTIYSDENAPVQQIIGTTQKESVTLITCDGVFDKQLQEYNNRRVVRAVRSA